MKTGVCLLRRSNKEGPVLPWQLALVRAQPSTHPSLWNVEMC